jgi:hypothetical protein
MKAIFLSINLDGVACIEREERVVVKSVYHSVLGLIGCFRDYPEISISEFHSIDGGDKSAWARVVKSRSNDSL